MSGVKCISKYKKLFILSAVIGCAFALSGCGRVIHNDYESMRASDSVNPMVTSQTSSVREKSFASGLCLPEDTKSDKLNIETAGLFDLSSRKTLYGNGINKRVFPASTTKLMTALVAIKNGDPNQRIRISERANDVAIAIAENIGGSYDGFVEMMNQEARAIGATGTHFTNPHGLHDENHYTTPYDLYLILNEAVKYDLIRKVIPQSGYNTMFVGTNGDSKSIAVNATDAYLTGDVDAPEGITVLGGKTGTTEPAGHCLIILSQNAKGNDYISVVMKTDSLEELYDDMNSLLAEIPN